MSISLNLLIRKVRLGDESKRIYFLDEVAPHFGV